MWIKLPKMAPATPAIMATELWFVSPGGAVTSVVFIWLSVVQCSVVCFAVVLISKHVFLGTIIKTYFLFYIVKTYIWSLSYLIIQCSYGFYLYTHLPVFCCISFSSLSCMFFSSPLLSCLSSFLWWGGFISPPKKIRCNSGI